MAATNQRILLIDDDVEIQDFITTFLGIEGYQVLLAANGATGLTAARRERPDLILLDISMPDISGVEVCQRLRAGAETAATPIFILSARTDDRERERAAEAGASRFVDKPFQNDALLRWISEALQAAGSNE